jgi:hypothetical protein
MGTAFSSSLFGLAGSLIVGFLDLQAGRAQTRFYTELENWLSTVTDLGSDFAPPMPPRMVGRRDAHAERNGCAACRRPAAPTSASTAAMASLADGISGLVKNMRNEQQLMRDWVEAQSEEQKENARDARPAGAGRAEASGKATEMALARAPPRAAIDYWPGFVDALVDAAAGDHVPAVGLRAGAVPAEPRDQRQGRGADRLNSQINELTQLLALERSNTQDSSGPLANLQASLEVAVSERSRLEQQLLAVVPAPGRG